MARASLLSPALPLAARALPLAARARARYGEQDKDAQTSAGMCAVQQLHAPPLLQPVYRHTGDIVMGNPSLVCSHVAIC